MDGVVYGNHRGDFFRSRDREENKRVRTHTLYLLSETVTEDVFRKTR